MVGVKDFFKGKYQVKTICTNCGQIQMHNVPQGITILEYFKDKSLGQCENCKCYTLEIANKDAKVEEKKLDNIFFKERRKKK